MMKIKGVRRPVLLGTVMMSLGVTVAAESNGIKAPASKRSTYWTSDRMRDAQPLTLPVANLEPPSAQAKTTTAVPPPPSSSNFSTHAHKPRKMKPTRGNQLFVPIYRYTDSRASEAEKPRPIANAAGVEAAQFSSSRLVPLSADTTFPYSAVGRIYFTVPTAAGGASGDYYCTGAVISRRVVLTAGHCLHSGRNGGDGWYTNWRFIPAFRDGSAPYGTWEYSEAKVTTTWMNGGGNLPNPADYGLLVFKDRDINGRIRKLGNTAGYLGVQTKRLSSNHVHMLAYPCNIDDCNKMHQVTAQNFRATDVNTVEYGSDMGLGSSGGPWVQNFGAAGTGQVPGQQNTEMNQVVGLVSYGFGSTTYLVQGSSDLDERFQQLWNEVCAEEGNCSP